MRIHDLSPAPGSRRVTRRRGRGIGSGLGKTAGKGHKGQKARAGGGVRRGFEGGQTPLFRHLPKRGFNNAAFKKYYATVNLRSLASFEPGSVVTPDDLLAKGIIKNLKDGVVILATGGIDRPLTVRAHRFSRAAQEKIEAAGGKAEVI